MTTLETGPGVPVASLPHAPVESEHVRRPSAETRVAFALVLSCVAATVLSRPLSVYAGLPDKLNYAHFALAVAATLLLMSPRNTGINVRMRVVLGLFLCVSIFSWLWNGESSLVGAALSWLVLAEPLMVVAAAAELVARGYRREVFERAALMLVIVQVPFAAFQLATIGIGDPVQGLLVRQGAGSHVLGFMAMIVAIWTFSRILSGSTRENVPRQLLVLAVCVMLGVVTDTKQGFVVFVAVCAALVAAPSFRGPRTRLARRVLLAIVMVALVAAGVQLNSSTSQVGNASRRSNFVEVKVNGTVAFVSAMRGESGGLLFGLGPGRTASRVAWLAMNDTTLQQLGVAPSETTASLWGVWRHASNDQSSAASPFFSWLGVLGDVGLLGLGVYLAGWLALWRFIGHSDNGRSGRAVIAFVFVLGFLFNWMEEPALMAVAALLLGASGSPPRSSAAHRYAVGSPTTQSRDGSVRHSVWQAGGHPALVPMRGKSGSSVDDDLAEADTLPRSIHDNRRDRRPYRDRRTFGRPSGSGAG